VASTGDDRLQIPTLASFLGSGVGSRRAGVGVVGRRRSASGSVDSALHSLGQMLFGLVDSVFDISTVHGLASIRRAAWLVNAQREPGLTLWLAFVQRSPQ
jgi:hypothetical protein